jgi:hypothetical protein
MTYYPWELSREAHILALRDQHDDYARAVAESLTRTPFPVDRDKPLRWLHQVVPTKQLAPQLEQQARDYIDRLNETWIEVGCTRQPDAVSLVKAATLPPCCEFAARWLTEWVRLHLFDVFTGLVGTLIVNTITAPCPIAVRRRESYDEYRHLLADAVVDQTQVTELAKFLWERAIQFNVGWDGAPGF